LLTFSSDRPNILWISCEDLSPHIGAYGDPIAKTPHIDQLAQGGMFFERAYTTAGLCAPSRSGIITAMYQTSIGTQHMRTNAQIDGLPNTLSSVPPYYVKTFTEYFSSCLTRYETNGRATASSQRRLYVTLSVE